MTIGSVVARSAQVPRSFDVLAEPHRLPARVRSAENRATGMLVTHSRHPYVKVRELAESQRTVAAHVEHHVEHIVGKLSAPRREGRPP